MQPLIENWHSGGENDRVLLVSGIQCFVLQIGDCGGVPAVHLCVGMTDCRCPWVLTVHICDYTMKISFNPCKFFQTAPQENFVENVKTVES